MAKKEQTYSPFGNMGEKIKSFFSGTEAEQPGIVRAGRGVRNAILTGGASIANDVDAEKDKPFGKALRRAGEVASTAVLTGGASIAPQVLGGDSYRPQQGPPAPPAVKAKPKTAKPASSPSTSAPAAVRRTTTVAAPNGRDARFDAIYAEEKRRMGPSGRGGGGNEARDRAARRLAKEEGRVNSTAYKRGETVAVAKKRNSIHNTKGLKWFRGGDD